MEVSAEGRPIELGTRKERLLLGLLLTDRSVVSLDRLIDALWETDPPGKPETSIRSYVSNIRRTLGAHVDDPKELLVSEDGGYSLSLDGHLVDAVELERLLDQARTVDAERAIALLDDGLGLVRGEPLADLQYAEFAQPEIRRLSELVLNAEELRAEVAIGCGLAVEVLPKVSGLVAKHPLRDGLRRAHMTALAATGRHAEALRSYQEHRHRLVEEMGIDPSPALRELESQILAEDGPFAAPPAAHEDRPAEVEQPTTEPVTDGPTPPVVERRQLTVLACELASSDGDHQDPEDLRAVLRDIAPTWRQTISRLGGQVQRFDGPTLVACFGYPVAHEDDVERAIRAGLEIAAGHPDAVRVGVATGTVVVDPGDAVDETGPVELIGDAPTTAIRLRDRAATGTVLVNGQSRRLTIDRFRFARTDAEDAADGEDGDEDQAIVEGPLRASARRPWLVGDGGSPFTGRQEELALLARRFELAAGGDGQVVFLGGEAGVGKSRIVAELLSTLDQGDERPSVVQLQCSPFHQSAPLQPIVEHILDLAGCEDRDHLPERVAKLDALFERAANAEELRLISSIGHLDNRPPLAEQMPDVDERRTRLMDAAVSVIERADGEAVAVCVVEDVHWVDASTRAVLDRLIETSSERRTLIIVTHRPGFWHTYDGAPNCTTLTLGPIARGESLAIARHLAAGKHLSPEIEAAIVSRADGIPLFVEEIAKAVLEQEGTGQDDRTAVDGPGLQPVPLTLHDSLMARLDRSPGGRSVAQAAAAIGRSFDRGLVARVIAADVERVARELESLVEAGILIGRGSGADTVYRFKHALIRDTAYQSLLREARWSLHAEIATAFEEEQEEGDAAAIEPVLLAQHWQGARRTDRALHWWTVAARQALESSALDEAIDCAARALAIAEGQPDDVDGRSPLVEPLLLRGTAEAQLLGPGSAVVGGTYRTVLDLGQAAMTPQQYYRAVWGSWYHETIDGNRQAMRELSEELYRLATTMDDEDLLIEAHHVQWSSMVLDGQLERSRWHTLQVEHVYDHERHHGLAYVYSGHDPGVCMHGIGALAAWLLGEPDEARVNAEAATTLTDHPNSVLEGCFGPLVVALLDRDIEAIGAMTARLEALVAQGAIPAEALGLARGFSGAATTLAGELAAGAEVLGAAAGDWQRLWGAYCYPLDSANADALSRLGEHDAALAIVDGLLAQPEERRPPWWDGELHRVRAAVMLRIDPDDRAAMAWLERGADIAAGQGARALELRALVDLVNAGQRFGEADAVVEPLDRLQELVDHYPATARMADLDTARRTLADVGGRRNGS